MRVAATYDLEHAADAHACLESRKARGKVLLRVAPSACISSSEDHTTQAIPTPAVSTPTKHKLRMEELTRVREITRSGGVVSSVLIALAEGIHDRAIYDQYARANSAMLEPHAHRLVVANRKYASDQRCTTLFQSAAAPAGPGDSGTWSTVDRCPLVFARGDAVLQWIGSDEYVRDAGGGGVGGNVAVRLRAARRCQLHLCYSTEDDLFGGKPLSTLADALAAGPLPIAVIETYRGAEQGERREIEAALAAGGAQKLLARRGGDPWVLVEGDAVEALDVYRFNAWEDLERCAASASLREAVAAFDAAGGCARAVAFEAG